MQDLIEGVKGFVEDAIMDDLYDLFPEGEVDSFIKNLSDELLSPEIIQAIEELRDMVSDRVEELVEQKDEDKDEDE